MNLSQEKWQPELWQIGEEIWIVSTKGYSMPYAMWRVTPPNFIERLLGIKFWEKLIRAKGKCQRYCDRLNEAEQIAADALRVVQG